MPKTRSHSSENDFIASEILAGCSAILASIFSLNWGLWRMSSAAATIKARCPLTSCRIIESFLFKASICSGVIVTGPVGKPICGLKCAGFRRKSKSQRTRSVPVLGHSNMGQSGFQECRSLEQTRAYSTTGSPANYVRCCARGRAHSGATRKSRRPCKSPRGPAGNWSARGRRWRRPIGFCKLPGPEKPSRTEFPPPIDPGALDRK